MRATAIAAVLLLIPASLGVDWQVITHEVAMTPRRVRVAPLDGDGLPDLVFTAGPDGVLVSNQLVVWLGLGNGRFDRHWGEVVITDFGNNGVPLQVADLDQDGSNDLVLGNVNGTGGFTVRLGDGSGSFPSESFGPSFGGYIDGATVTDYNGDGLPDVGTTTQDLGWYVDRFDGQGDGGFGINLPFSTFNGGFGPHAIASGDVTGDGLGDDIVSNPNGLFLVRSLGPSQALLDLPCDRSVVTDLDGDGLADIAATAPLDKSVVVLRSLGAGAFAPPSLSATGRRPGGIVATDLDLDGDLDLAVANAAGRSVSLLTNDGAAQFGASGQVTVGRGPVDLAAGDLDADGDPDLVVANAAEASLSVLLNPLR